MAAALRNEPALRTEPEAERTPCDKRSNKAGSKMGKIAVFGNGGREAARKSAERPGSRKYATMS